VKIMVATLALESGEDLDATMITSPSYIYDILWGRTPPPPISARAKPFAAQLSLWTDASVGRRGSAHAGRSLRQRLGGFILSSG
jgi:hypothetical protein